MNENAKRYVEEVLGRVLAPAARKESLRSDLEGHFHAAAEAGETPEAVIGRLGPPEEVAASFMDGVELTYAGFWERFVAFMGDVGMMLVALSPLVGICALLGLFGESGPEPLGVVLALFLALAVVSGGALALLYFPFLEHFYGRTFGKAALRLRVVSERGAPIGLGTAFLRRLSFYLEILWADALFIPFTEKKQRAFDIVAKTLVVREPEAERTFLGWLLCLAPWLLILAVGCLAALFAAT